MSIFKTTTYNLCEKEKKSRIKTLAHSPVEFWESVFGAKTFSVISWLEVSRAHKANFAPVKSKYTCIRQQSE